MFSNYLTISALLLTAVSAVPLARRDSCELGTFNCISSTQYAMCGAGGIWSQAQPVPAGMTCQGGISSNPFVPSGDSSAATEPESSAPSGSPAPKGVKSGDSGAAPSGATPTGAAPTGEATPESTPESAPTAPPAPTPEAPSPAASVPTASPQSQDGASCGGFPCISSWPTFEELKAKFQPIMGTSCEANGWGANNSPDETAQVLSAIESLSGSVDPRFVLSIVIQESAGCVRVITTNNGVRNPGLMQDANGAHTCNDAGSVQNPCPSDEITGMIADGVSGGTDNLTKALASAQGAPNNFQDALAFAVAARIYNSGSFDIGNLNDGLGSTAAYVTGVMNRVAGLAL